MPGLTLWDQYGRVIFDSSSVVVTVLGTAVIGGDGQPYSGQIIDDRLASGGTPFFQTHFVEANPLIGFSPVERVTFNGNVLNYSFFNNGNHPARTKLVYGLL